MHLYVRRSFVTDKFDDILPVTLSFVKGIVDSDDLPLNISRETLQNTVALRNIKAKVVSKAIEMFKHLAEDPDRKEDWKIFQTTIMLTSNLRYPGGRICVPACSLVAL